MTNHAAISGITCLGNLLNIKLWIVYTHWIQCEHKDEYIQKLCGGVGDKRIENWLVVGLVFNLFWHISQSLLAFISALYFLLKWQVQFLKVLFSAFSSLYPFLEMYRHVFSWFLLGYSYISFPCHLSETVYTFGLCAKGIYLLSVSGDIWWKFGCVSFIWGYFLMHLYKCQ